MLKICALCGKGELPGKKVVRKGLAKKKGGTGSKISDWTKRRFLPNLQKMRIIINDKISRAYVCARCIKKTDFQKAI